MRFETCRVIDHPVCGAAVASRLFIDAAAALLGKEGKVTKLNGFLIRSDALISAVEESP